LKEESIIKGCKAGNQLAYKALVDSYSSYIYTICRRYAPNDAVAKDCMQESLIQVISKINLYEERGKFRSWVATVTVKKCLDILRKEKRHLSSELDNVPEPFRNESVSYQLEKQDVMRFLETLPDQYRVAINMFLIEGYSHKEIGKHLGINESSSRSLVSRARKLIVESFNKESQQANYSSASRTGVTSGFKMKMIRT